MNILWIPHTSWLSARRAQVFAHGLAQLGHFVHVIDSDHRHHTLHERISLRSIRNTDDHRADGTVAVHGVPRIVTSRLNASVRDITTRKALEAIAALIDHYQIDIVISSLPYMPAAAKRFVADLADDNLRLWCKPNGAYPQLPELDAPSEIVLAAADAVVLGSAAVADHVRGAGMRQAVMIPNAKLTSEGEPPVADNAGVPQMRHMRVQKTGEADGGNLIVRYEALLSLMMSAYPLSQPKLADWFVSTEVVRAS